MFFAQAADGTVLLLRHLVMYSVDVVNGVVVVVDVVLTFALCADRSLARRSQELVRCVAASRDGAAADVARVQTNVPARAFNFA